MPRISTFLRCLCEAVISKGIKSLVGEIPFVSCLVDVGEDCYHRLRMQANAEQIRIELDQIVQQSAAEAARQARAAVQELAPNQPQAIQQSLQDYLEQLPATIRQSMRRPADPTGRSALRSTRIAQANDLIPLIPAYLPKFKAGSRSPAGNWILVERVGVGGFGEVWKAEHPNLSDLPPVALKFCLDAAAARTLRHEASLLSRVMSQVQHRGIVKLRQAYLDQDPPCLEYEYVAGGTLAGMANDWKRLPIDKRIPKAELVIRVLSAIIEHTHRLSPPIVHRDLKPANILMHPLGGNKFDLRVADFGIGGLAAQKSLGAHQVGTPSRAAILSSTLRGAHTPLYASPQQRNGEAPDPRDDIFSLGVIWYQLLVGDLTRGVGADFATDLNEIGVAAATIDILQRCVASKAERRFANAGELRVALAGLAQKDDVDPLLSAIPVEIPVVYGASEKDMHAEEVSFSGRIVSPSDFFETFDPATIRKQVRATNVQRPGPGESATSDGELAARDHSAFWWAAGVFGVAGILMVLACGVGLHRLFHDSDPASQGDRHSSQQATKGKEAGDSTTEKNRPVTPPTTQQFRTPELADSNPGFQRPGGNGLDFPVIRENQQPPGPPGPREPTGGTTTNQSSASDNGSARPPSPGNQESKKPGIDPNREIMKDGNELLRQAISDLVEQLKSKDYRERSEAARRLGLLGPLAFSEAARPLCVGILDNNAAVRQAAFDALQRVAPTLHEQVLVILVDGELSKVHGALIKLKNMGPKAEAVTPIISAIVATDVAKKKGERRLSLHALRCLASIAPDDASLVVPLKNLVLTTDEETLRTIGIGHLGSIGKLNPKTRKPILPALTACMTSKEPETVVAAIDAVGSFGPDAKSTLSTLRAGFRFHANQQIRNAANRAISMIEQD